jgi:hypothetical protein
MQLKAFIFTLDAMIALSLVVAGAYALAMFQTSATEDNALQLQMLARDFLIASGNTTFNTSQFTNLTGFGISTTAGGVSQSARVIGHAFIFEHPLPCTNASSVGGSNACLTGSDANVTQIKREAWTWP